MEEGFSSVTPPQALFSVILSPELNYYINIVTISFVFYTMCICNKNANVATVKNNIFEENNNVH